MIESEERNHYFLLSGFGLVFLAFAGFAFYYALVHVDEDGVAQNDITTIEIADNSLDEINDTAIDNDSANNQQNFSRHAMDPSFHPIMDYEGECTDSDGGIAKFEKGFMFAPNDGFPNREDKCIDEFLLNEIFCGKTSSGHVGPASRDIECEFGCHEGRCRAREDVTPEDIQSFGLRKSEHERSLLSNSDLRIIGMYSVPDSPKVNEETTIYATIRNDGPEDLDPPTEEKHQLIQVHASIPELNQGIGTNYGLGLPVDEMIGMQMPKIVFPSPGIYNVKTNVSLLSAEEIDTINNTFSLQITVQSP